MSLKQALEIRRLRREISKKDQIMQAAVVNFFRAEKNFKALQSIAQNQQMKLEFIEGVSAQKTAEIVRLHIELGLLKSDKKPKNKK